MSSTSIVPVLMATQKTNLTVQEATQGEGYIALIFACFVLILMLWCTIDCMRIKYKKSKVQLRGNKR